MRVSNVGFEGKSGPEAAACRGHDDWFISQVMQVYASDKDGRAHSSSRWQPELPDAWR